MEILQIKAMLKAAGDIISEFLRKHGGLGNGCETWAEGSIEFHISGMLEISVHRDNITVARLHKLANDLEEKLLEHFGDDFLREYGPVIVRKERTEGDCFETYLEVSTSVRVDMWGKT